MKEGTQSESPSAGKVVYNIRMLKHSIAFHLRRAQEASFQAFSARAGEADLSPGHFAILEVIHGNPGLNQTALGAAVGRDKSTLTPTLKALEQHGFVKRTRSQHDQRANHLHLTAEGRKLLDRLAVHAFTHDQLLDSIIGEVHKPLLIHLLSLISRELRARARMIKLDKRK
jgi:DNA-binding MarR family transcriptional regulator